MDYPKNIPTVKSKATRWEELVERQRVREENACSMGEVRFRKRLLEAREGGEGSTVGATRKMLKMGLDNVDKAIRNLLDERLGEWDGKKRSGGPKGRRHILVAWSKVCEDTFNDPEIYPKNKDGESTAPKGKKPIDTGAIAYIALKTVLDHIHHRATLFSLSTQIAERLVAEMRYRYFRTVAPGLFRYKMDEFTNGNYGHRDRSLSAAMRGADIDASMFSLSTKQKEQLGSLLLDFIGQTTGLIKLELSTTYDWGKGGVKRKDQYEIVTANPKDMDWMNTRNGKLEILTPMHTPMVVPPLPWGKGQKGGYLFALRMRDNYGFVRGFSTEADEAVKDVDMPIVYEAINRLQETPFKVNRPVLSLMQQIEELGGGRADIPERERIPEPVRPFDFDSVPEEKLKEDPRFKEWMKKAKDAHDKEAARVLAYTHHMRLVDAATDDAKEEAIYFPWNVDFRGRAYPISDTLNPQGDDRQKALLTFAEGKPLGEDGSFYLAVHGANCLDEIPECFPPVVVDGEEIRKFGRLSIQERNDWIEAHTLDIVKVFANPLTHTWWQDADKPWMFFAFCVEWAGYWAAYKQGKGEEFVSCLPVAADGTCNGLQHFAALWRDEIGGRYVNLIPSERPEDVYDRIRAVVDGEVQAEAGSGDPIAIRWVESGMVCRKGVKRPTMTFSYGSEVYGFTNQLIEFLEEKWGKKAAKSFFELWDPITGVKLCDLRKACHYLAWKIWYSLDGVVVKAKAGMQWFQECARVVAGQEGQAIRWEVPGTGFVVVQGYHEQVKKQIRTVLLGKTINPAVYENTDKVDARKQATAISPNIIHSLDAAAMMMTVVNCAREQDNMSFLMVHDSYATHAGDAYLMAKVLRESFIQLYTHHDVLQHLRSQFALQAPAEDLPEPPTKGSLDVADVLFSDHFFC